jgi:riboflavin transport system permease protein
MTVNKQALYSGIIALGAACLCVALLLLGWSKNPAHALVMFLTGTFQSPYNLGNMLSVATLFMTAGLGSALAIKGGLLNLGGEGQIYAGGFITALLLNAFIPASGKNFFPASPIVASVITAIAACAAGSAITTISALLKDKKGAHELLTTFLCSAALIPLIDSAISGKFRTPTGNLLATPFISQSVRFHPILPPSSFNLSFFIAIFLCIAGAWYLYKTTTGRKHQIWGIAPEFAQYCGYSRQNHLYATLAISGGLHGLAGFFAVSGTYYTCHVGFSTGIGWDALSCAFIANTNPILVIPVSIALSWIFTSADRITLTENFGFDIAGLIQGIVLFCIALRFIGLKVTKNKKKRNI